MEETLQDTVTFTTEEQPSSTIKQNLKQELMRYLDRLPDTLLAEVLLFIKFLMFREQQPAPSEQPPEPKTNPEDDPLWQIVGLGRSEVKDLSINHDKYLAEIELQSNRR